MKVPWQSDYPVGSGSSFSTMPGTFHMQPQSNFAEPMSAMPLSVGTWQGHQVNHRYSQSRIPMDPQGMPLMMQPEANPFQMYQMATPVQRLTTNSNIYQDDFLPESFQARQVAMNNQQGMAPMYDMNGNIDYTIPSNTEHFNPYQYAAKEQSGVYQHQNNPIRKATKGHSSMGEKKMFKRGQNEPDDVNVTGASYETTVLHDPRAEQSKETGWKNDSKAYEAPKMSPNPAAGKRERLKAHLIGMTEKVAKAEESYNTVFSKQNQGVSQNNDSYGLMQPQFAMRQTTPEGEGDIYAIEAILNTMYIPDLPKLIQHLSTLPSNIKNKMFTDGSDEVRFFATIHPRGEAPEHLERTQEIDTYRYKTSLSRGRGVNGQCAVNFRNFRCICRVVSPEYPTSVTVGYWGYTNKSSFLIGHTPYFIKQNAEERAHQSVPNLIPEPQQSDENRDAIQGKTLSWPIYPGPAGVGLGKIKDPSGVLSASFLITTVPSQPTITELIQISPTSAKLSWTAENASKRTRFYIKVGSENAFFQAQKATDGYNRTTSVTSAELGTDFLNFETVLGDFNEGQQYWISISAENFVGQGLYCNPRILNLVTKVDPITSVTAIATGPETINVQWDADENVPEFDLYFERRVRPKYPVTSAVRNKLSDQELRILDGGQWGPSDCPEGECPNGSDWKTNASYKVNEFGEFAGFHSELLKLATVKSSAIAVPGLSYEYLYNFWVTPVKSNGERGVSKCLNQPVSVLSRTYKPAEPSPPVATKGFMGKVIFQVASREPEISKERYARFEVSDGAKTWETCITRLYYGENAEPALSVEPNYFKVLVDQITPGATVSVKVCLGNEAGCSSWSQSSAAVETPSVENEAWGYKAV